MGKRYNDKNKLIFEGEFLNMNENGKGKEYSALNGKLLFEGEYYNDYKNGRGTEYYSNNNIKF